MCLKRGFPDAAVTTVVAGSRQDVRRGQQDKDSYENSNLNLSLRLSLCGETSCIGGHFGEAVEQTAEPGLLAETHTCDERGMRSEGWVTVVCGVIGESGYV